MDVKDFVNVLGCDFYTGVPDSQLKALCNYLMNMYGIDKNHHIIAANEGNCAAIAAGYYLSTNNIPVVYMQNSGEGNIINPVASLLNDNVTFNENIVLLNHNNRIYNDITSLNNTDISIGKNNYFNPYIINNNNGIVNTNLNNYYDYNNFIGNNNPNISSNSSHITSLLKMPKMKTK